MIIAKLKEIREDAGLTQKQEAKKNESCTIHNFRVGKWK